MLKSADAKKIIKGLEEQGVAKKLEKAKKDGNKFLETVYKKQLVIIKEELKVTQN